jgi:hypothetical protein
MKLTFLVWLGTFLDKGGPVLEELDWDLCKLLEPVSHRCSSVLLDGVLVGEGASFKERFFSDFRRRVQRAGRSEGAPTGRWVGISDRGSCLIVLFLSLFK